MTYTHLTTNELVIIEAYYQEGATVSAIVASLGRSKQTIYKVIHYLEAGHTAYEYYEQYKTNKKCCGRRQTQLTQSEQDFFQGHLELNWSLAVVKGTYPDKIPCSMRTVYRLADRGIFKKDDLPCKGKRKPNGKAEKHGKQDFRRGISVIVQKSIRNSKKSSDILKEIRSLVNITKVLLSLSREAI